MLKVAIVGCGLIAVKKHIPALLRLKGKIEIAAVCDLNEDIAKKVADKFNLKKAYTNFSDMLIKERPDIVDICTPPQTHAQLTVQAIEGGAHVFLEKPMALKTSDCDTMISSAARHQKKICVVHNQMFNPAFVRARRLAAKGQIGKFLGIQIFLSTPTDYMTSKKDHWAHSLAGGVLGETGPHAVYLALAFLKNIYKAQVSAKKLFPEYPWSDFEDFRINLFAENGMGSISLIYGSNQWAADIDVIGAKGTLKIDLQNQLMIKYNRHKLSVLSIGLTTLGAALQTIKALVLNGLRYILNKDRDGHGIGIREFVDSVLEDKPSPVSAQDGRETARVMEMIVEKLKCAESIEA